MTLLIIGTYRGTALVERAMRTIDKRLSGVTEIVLVDDSGKPDTSAQLARYGEVIQVGGKGYNTAMKAVCQRAGDAPFMFWEEDFILNGKVHLGDLADILDARPHLAQVALLRQAWFRNEVRAGGLIQALKERGEDVQLIGNVWEQRATFTCNPALWRSGVAASGWPDGQWSEDAKRDQLIAEGYSFGFLDGVRVFHNGRRSGYGY